MNGEKEATVLGAFLVARFSVGGRRGSSGHAWDEELEGARDDSKFNGQMGKRFAIDLRVDRMTIERLVDQPAIGAGAGNAQEIFFLLRLFQRGSESQGNLFHRTAYELFRGAGNVPGQVQFLGEDVGGAAGEKSQGNAPAVLTRGETVHDFVQGAVATAGDNESAAFVGGALRDFRGMSGPGSFRQIGIDAIGRKNVPRRIE